MALELAAFRTEIHPGQFTHQLEQLGESIEVAAYLHNTNATNLHNPSGLTDLYTHPPAQARTQVSEQLTHCHRAVQQQLQKRWTFHAQQKRLTEVNADRHNANPPSENLNAARWQSTLLRAEAVSLTSLNSSVAPPADIAAEHDHEHNHLLFVDLDEAAHSTYALFKFLIDAFDSSPQHLKNAFIAEADQWRDHPFQALQHDFNASGAGEFIASLGIAGLTLGLAIVAFLAGKHEAQTKKRELKALTATQASVQTQLNAVSREIAVLNTRRQTLTADSPLASMATIDHQIKGLQQIRLAQHVDDLDTAIRLTRDDCSIGKLSAASGAAIAFNTSTNIAVKTAIAVQTKSLATTAILTEKASLATAATVAGFAGTFILAPIASMFAVALGIVFVRKSNRSVRRFDQDRRGSLEHINRVEALLDRAKRSRANPMTESADLVRYKAFLDRKFTQRSQFFHYFQRWNKRFLKGSALYATVSLTKMGLGIAAVAAAGALVSNPVGWGILLAVGIVGALMMGFASHQFLFGHGQHSRYDAYFLKDHAWLDRSFLSQLDNVSRATTTTRPLDQISLSLDTLGLRMRARFHQLIRQLKTVDDEFLSSWKQQASTLNPFFKTRRLAKWLKEDAQITLRQRSLKKLLSAHIDYLIHKIDARFLVTDSLQTDAAAGLWVSNLDLETVDRGLSHHDSVATTPTATNLTEAAAIVPSYLKTVVEMDQALHQEQTQLEQLRALQQRLKEGDATQLPSLESTVWQALGFDATSHLPSADPGKTTEKNWAQYWRVALPQQLRDLRGMLIETELQAARLVDRQKQGLVIANAAN